MKLDTKKTVLIGMAFFSICIFWQVYDNEIPLILTNRFGLGAGAVGAVMALDNCFAVALLPFFGTLSDRTNTRFGKRMPYIAAGTLVSALLFVLLAAAADRGRLPLFVVILLLLLIAMSFYRSPAVALMPDVTPERLRSQGNAIINLVGAVGAVVALILIPVFGNTASSLPLFGTIAAIMIASALILVFLVDENRLREEREALERTEGTAAEDVQTQAAAEESGTGKRSMAFLLLCVAFVFFSHNAVSTAFSRYYQIHWGMADKGYSRCLLVATVVAVAGYIPAGRAAGYLGRRRSIQLGTGILALSFAAIGAFPGFHPALNLAFAGVGIGLAFFNVNSYPMVVEMSGGGDIGKYTGMYYAATMSAQIVTPILSGFLIEKLGYGVLFPYAVVFALLALLLSFFVRSGDSRPERRGLLEEFGDMDI